MSFHTPVPVNGNDMEKEGLEIVGSMDPVHYFPHFGYKTSGWDTRRRSVVGVTPPHF